MDTPEENPNAPIYPGSTRPWLFNKGEVDNDGDVLRACDERFLVELLLKMEQGYENVFQFVFFKNVPEEDTDEKQYGYFYRPTSEELGLVVEDILLAIDDAAALFTEIAKEIRRLQRYQDLYPSRPAMKRFHKALATKMEEQHQRTLDAANKMQNQACWKKLHQAEYLIELWLKHPTFLPHLKPWEQFLMDDAPGSGINPRAKFLGKVPESDQFELSTISENSTFHVLPPGGMALWADWTKTYEELEKKCKQTNIPERFSSNPTGSPANRQSGSSILSGFGTRVETIPFMLEQNLWFPEQPSGPNLIPANNLPFISSLISNLEGIEDHVPAYGNYTAGLIVASEPSDEPITIHHTVDF